VKENFGGAGSASRGVPDAALGLCDNPRATKPGKSNETSDGFQAVRIAMMFSHSARQIQAIHGIMG